MGSALSTVTVAFSLATCVDAVLVCDSGWIVSATGDEGAVVAAFVWPASWSCGCSLAEAGRR
jgi:hypothetical protein